MKRILPLIILSATPIFAQSTVPGAWTITGDVQGYPILETCTFTQAQEKITGSCTVADGKKYDTIVTVTDQKVVIVHASEYEGQPLTLTYTGTLNDKGEISGAIGVKPLGYDGTFTAKKTDKAEAK